MRCEGQGTKGLGSEEPMISSWGWGSRALYQSSAVVADPRLDETACDVLPVGRIDNSPGRSPGNTSRRSIPVPSGRDELVSF
jgi:hypothetical protein